MSWSLSNIAAKRASAGGTHFTSTIMLAASWIPIAPLALVSPLQIGPIGMLMGVLSGFATALGNLAFYRALETQQASNTYGTTVVQSILIGAFGFLLLGSSLSALDVLGSLVGVVGVLMVGADVRRSYNRMLLPAILGNALWAVGWGLAGYGIKYYGSAPDVLNVTRAAGLALLIAVYGGSAFRARLRGAAARKRRTVIFAGVIAGVLSGAGSITLAYLADTTYFALGGVLTSFVPALVAVLAFLIYKDRLSRLQGAGIIVATVGALMIAA